MKYYKNEDGNYILPMKEGYYIIKYDGNILKIVS